MTIKKTPYIFLAILFIILAFILGARYGQRVEKTNKAIDYLISLPPTKAPLPTPTPWKKEDYKSKKWGLHFYFPSFLKVREDPTGSAVYIELKK